MFVNKWNGRVREAFCWLQVSRVSDKVETEGENGNTPSGALGMLVGAMIKTKKRELESLSGSRKDESQEAPYEKKSYHGPARKPPCFVRRSMPEFKNPASMSRTHDDGPVIGFQTCKAAKEETDVPMHSDTSKSAKKSFSVGTELSDRNGNDAATPNDVKTADVPEPDHIDQMHEKSDGYPVPREKQNLRISSVKDQRAQEKSVAEFWDALKAQGNAAPPLYRHSVPGTQVASGDNQVDLGSKEHMVGLMVQDSHSEEGQNVNGSCEMSARASDRGVAEGGDGGSAVETPLMTRGQTYPIVPGKGDFVPHQKRKRIILELQFRQKCES